MIVTRFPPSPTGHLHLGGARTALFNWLYARHTKGKFILRMEDTDTARSTPEFVESILESLRWLGIDWDEGPYFQSRRFSIYREYMQKLLDSGHAYYCDCPPERLESIRKRAMASGGKPKYDGKCRDRGLKASQDTVVRFKAPLIGATVLNDAVKGNIVFDNTELDDFIIVRKDGTPTYNFVVVVDDVTMGINMILRGDDHVMNTPKQILIYKALGADLPVFAHVPMVLGHDRSRLSKRHGALSVLAYRDMGYLPEALINYLVRLGWSYGDQEIFTREELIDKFSMERLGKSPGIFNPEKLLAVNAEHMKLASDRYLAERLLPFLSGQGLTLEDGPNLESVVSTLKERSKTLSEMADAARFYFTETVAYEEAAAEKFLTAESARILRRVVQQLETSPDFGEKALEDAFRAVMEETGLKLGKIAQPVRVALTGKTASPGIFEILHVLGKARAVGRLKRAVEFIEGRSS
ncbi:MAG: glutamate--tRNA ligase [Deltaproteobacteria bacterium]|nr:glutamate--tRNA ligase [Deltaproteobacteria bacterium]MBW2131868.1 glutamate--tRNA ligase [Deltaproteobacteria bacterium]